MKKCMIAVVATVFALGASAKGPTRVQLWFDTEDYTLDKSNDAIRELANVMTEEGVRGHFNIAGHLARVILENRRDDVREALKPHLVGTQSLYHSRHPNITELTDLADYDEAYRRCLAEEAEGFGYLKAAFGLQDQFLSCYPGNGSSYVALDVHADLGSHFHGGLGALDNLKRGDAMWYQNIRQILYNAPLNMEAYVLGSIGDEAVAKGLDACAEFEAVVFYLHPHMLIRCQHWDIDNFLKGNNVTFGKWNTPELRTPEFTAQCYRNFRAFIRKVKADPRFTFTDCARLQATQEPRTAIWAEDVPAIRAALLKDFGPVSSPASWCVADCFQAAVKFLCGEKKHVPGKVYGFLERPVGVKEKTVVKAADLRAAAQKIVFRRHLPVSYDVGGAKLGPADFLFAALEVLETGAEEVAVEPREQLGDIAARLPKLARFSHVKPAWCIYWPQFKDKYLADRLRWQFWTLRFEGEGLKPLDVQGLVDATPAGGTVRIPAGLWEVKPFRLKGDLTLELDAHATVFASTNLADYASAEGERTFVSATDAANLTICGKGILDGRGAVFKERGGLKGEDQPQSLPVMLRFTRCRNLTLKDFTYRDGGAWGCHLRNCDGVTVRGVTCFNHVNATNDGIDIESSNVTIEDCDIDADDDAIVFKTESDRSFPVTNVVIRNCRMASCCNALKFGTGSYCDVRDVLVENCRFDRPKGNFRFNWKKTYASRGVIEDLVGLGGMALEVVDGGRMENVTVRNVDLDGYIVPIFVRLARRHASADPRGSYLRNVLIENVKGACALSRNGCSITGVPGLRPSDITLRNVSLAFPGGGTKAERDPNVRELENCYPEGVMFGRNLPAWGFYLRHADNVVFDNVRLTLEGPDVRERIVTDDCLGFQMHP